MKIEIVKIDDTRAEDALQGHASPVPPLVFVVEKSAMSKSPVDVLSFLPDERFSSPVVVAVVVLRRMHTKSEKNIPDVSL